MASVWPCSTPWWISASEKKVGSELTAASLGCVLLLSPTVDVEGVTVFPRELPHSDVGIGTATEAHVTIHPHSHAQHCTSAMYSTG